MAITSYAPLGRRGVLDDPTVTRVAAAHGRTPAQIVLRWHMQQPGNIAIPKSADPVRIVENFAIFDFALTEDEMVALSALARPNGRLLSPQTGVDWSARPR
jgi:diketogulonate reductase-like aldo/keto reductase